MKYSKIIISVCLFVASVLGIYFYLQVSQKSVVRDLEYKLNLLQQNNDKLLAELRVKDEQIEETKKKYSKLGEDFGMRKKELDITSRLIGEGGKFFPEDKKVLYLKCDYENRNPIQSLWGFDLKNWTKHKLLDIPNSQSVMPGEEGCDLYADSVSINGDKVIIKTHISGDKLSNITKEYTVTF